MALVTPVREKAGSNNAILPPTTIFSEDKITMPRQVISVSISDELLERMIDHFSDLGYSSLSEYIRELIRNDLRQNVQQGTMPVRYFGTRRRQLEQRKSR